MQLKTANETAKDLISKAIHYFESINDKQRIAAAQVELAYCYWWNGELNEARIMIHEALGKLTTEGNTRARALLKLTTIEHSSSRYSEALKILTDNVALFTRVSDPTTKAQYHNQLAMTLEELAVAEKRTDYFQLAMTEYQAADVRFKQSKNPVFRASVKNNVAVILLKLSRFKEAHKYLEEAKRLTIRFKDKLRTAQIDGTRAEVFIAEGKLKEAESVARRAATALEKGGHQCLLADALTTQGIALARLGRREQAQFIFQRAITVALQVDAYNKAGLAALALVEEVDNLPTATLRAAYRQAREWLASCDSQEILRRLNDAAAKVVSALQPELSLEEAREALAGPGDLQERMLKYENTLIRQALAQANGSVTHAASQLGMSYQALCYMIETRHKDLLQSRTPIRRRTKKSQ